MTTLKRGAGGGTLHDVLPVEYPSAGYPLRTPIVEVHLVSGECIEEIECHCCYPPPDRRTWWQWFRGVAYIGRATRIWTGAIFKIWEAVEV